MTCPCRKPHAARIFRARRPNPHATHSLASISRSKAVGRTRYELSRTRARCRAARPAARAGVAVHSLTRPIPAAPARRATRSATAQPDDVCSRPTAMSAFLRAGLSRQVLRKLRRGHWAIQDEDSDLHGITRRSARLRSAAFLGEAVRNARGAACASCTARACVDEPRAGAQGQGRLARAARGGAGVLPGARPRAAAGAVVVLLRG